MRRCREHRRQASESARPKDVYECGVVAAAAGGTRWPVCFAVARKSRSRKGGITQIVEFVDAGRPRTYIAACSPLFVRPTCILRPREAQQAIASTSLSIGCQLYRGAQQPTNARQQPRSAERFGHEV